MVCRRLMIKVCLCFGGPSDERNISAGSIKPWVTWLEKDPSMELLVLFFDRKEQAWILPRAYHYTNTCEDFEGLLAPEAQLDESQLAQCLQKQDIVVPLIHGRFGEDGSLQRRLEELDVAYVFSAPDALALTFDKRATYACLRSKGFEVPEHFSITPEDWLAQPELMFQKAGTFARDSGTKLCAIKPNRGGSSLGVSLVDEDRAEFDAAVNLAFEQDQEVLVEGVLSGTEFSVVVLDTPAGPLALAPTEVETSSNLYDTRSKYLHGSGTRLHTPLRKVSLADDLRKASLGAWKATGLRDMARIDGFYDEKGRVTVTDINGISGMGFSSFGFLQTSMAGIGHEQLIRLLLARAADRAGIVLSKLEVEEAHETRVHVLFGGPTSERQVSRQSGIFVGLGLMARGYDVRFVFMDRSSRFTEVGLFYALHHDVEEIASLIEAPERREEIAKFGEALAKELGAGLETESRMRNLHVGKTCALPTAVAEADFVFLALHGGPGEDGTLQAALQALGKSYNGSGPRSSLLCSNKIEAVERVRAAHIPGVAVPRQRQASPSELLDWVSEGAWAKRFASLQTELSSTMVILKPASDGCSTGVKLLANGGELERMVRAIIEMRPTLEAGELGPGSRPLQLPEPPPLLWLFEAALVDENGPELPAGDCNALNLQSWWNAKRFVEITCAVCELPKHGLQVAMPSLTIARAAELSLEEKFQQGVGTNLSLDAFLDGERQSTIRGRILQISNALGLAGYARLDCFYDRQEDELYLLEANTLCALTEATVFYSQMLFSFEASPPEALEWIVNAGQKRQTS
ncbi:MAG: D-alanine--D-alanine ligase [Planctomycetota bacterium]|jgi:D-alanine--D-alanine ligase